MSDPQPIWTAPAMPAAPAATTTAGGGTRSRARTSTSGCASGRKTASHRISYPFRGFRERASVSDRKSALAGTDELTRVVDLVPDVPKQHAARPAVLDVRDDALAVRLLPVLDRLEPRVDLPDGFVPKVEEVGVEKRQVVVRLCSAGHVGADDLAVHVRV